MDPILKPEVCVSAHQRKNKRESLAVTAPMNMCIKEGRALNVEVALMHTKNQTNEFDLRKKKSNTEGNLCDLFLQANRNARSNHLSLIVLQGFEI